jgi:hypothetical protein
VMYVMCRVYVWVFLATILFIFKAGERDFVYIRLFFCIKRAASVSVVFFSVG